MMVLWTAVDAEYIRTRSSRYPGAIDIEPAWADEAVADPGSLIADPDPHSRTGGLRITGYSPEAGFVLTVVAVRLGDELWGINAWKTSGGDRRAYREALEGR